jgi:hypothetical protein
MRTQVFDGYYRCLPAFARAGNNLIVDLIVEKAEQKRRLPRNWTVSTSSMSGSTALYRSLNAASARGATDA